MSKGERNNKTGKEITKKIYHFYLMIKYIFKKKFKKICFFNNIIIYVT